MFHLRAQTLALLGVVAALLVAESHCLPAQVSTKHVISQDELALSLVVNQIAVLKLLNESSTIYSLHERELDEKTEELKSELQNIKETALQQFQNMATATLSEINARNEETRQMLHDVKETALNKSRQVFNGKADEAKDGDEDDEEHELEERVSSNITSGRPRPLQNQRACTDKPPEPLNGRIDCSPYSGCRAVCNSRHQFPTGERRVFLRCEDGEWVVVGGGRSSVLSDCEPVCRPPCQNNGICLMPNRCLCPDNWQGATCETPKLPPPSECSRKPPVPANSKVFCRRDECQARCHEGYYFAESMTRLTYMCEDGDWVIRHGRFVGTNPNCEPAIVSTTATPKICESSWSKYQSSCYKVFKTEVDYVTSTANCRALGAYVATISSEGENSYVAGLIEANTYIGLSDEEQEGVYTWQDGSPFSYSKWASGEIPQPNDDGGHEDCVRMDTRSEWWDRPCSSSYHYICEKSLQ